MHRCRWPGRAQHVGVAGADSRDSSSAACGDLRASVDNRDRGSPAAARLGSGKEKEDDVFSELNGVALGSNVAAGCGREGLGFG